MSDIVERLRICAKFDPDQAEAADEIEKLRAALREIRNKSRTGRPPFMSSKTDFFQIASKALGEKDDAKV